MTIMSRLNGLFDLAVLIGIRFISSINKKLAELRLAIADAGLATHVQMFNYSNVMALEIIPGQPKFAAEFRVVTGGTSANLTTATIAGTVFSL
jgi:hypothetical protein